MTERDELLIEGMKIDARNYMRHNPRVWHEALEEAIDKYLPPLIEAVRAEERERIAAEINAIRNDPTLIELADKYGGWYQGQRTGLERAEARIREQGKEQGT